MVTRKVPTSEPCDNWMLDLLAACVTPSILIIVFFMHLSCDGSINISWCTFVPALLSLTKEILNII